VSASSTNQPPPFEGRNLFTIDAALQSAVAHYGASFAISALTQWGEAVGSAETYELADMANRHPPELRSFDRRGERIDEVTFHPAWHTLMQRAMQAGEHCAPWRESHAGAQVARAAMYYLHAQVENGTQCPLTMTYAGVPVLERHAASLPSFAAAWPRAVLGTTYDPRALPIDAKRSALIGMGMTERQGGSDVRANLTRAEPQRDGTWRIHGHKWFFSAPQCDAHLVLAQSDHGLGCFLMPRVAPDGTRNGIRLNRLKDKLGNRSNASAEVEFDGAVAFAVGAPDRGIATILEMVQYTRLDCVIGSAGIMRAAVAWAVHHARHRRTFGRTLIDHPLMTNVLADLAIESEAALTLAMFLARSVEHDADPALRAVARVVTPAAKYWVCKRAISVAAEAMEAFGGNGNIEEAPLARFYREAPVNSIWEGSGNVVCLDVLRALRREPDVTEAIATYFNRVRGNDRRLDVAIDSLKSRLLSVGDEPTTARRIAQDIALMVAAAEMIQVVPSQVVDALLASRLAEDGFGGAAFGNLPVSCDATAIVARTLA
jgi:putative acyl-CoA dehydrogenase